MSLALQHLLLSSCCHKVGKCHCLAHRVSHSAWVSTGSGMVSSKSGCSRLGAKRESGESGIAVTSSERSRALHHALACYRADHRRRQADP